VASTGKAGVERGRTRWGTARPKLTMRCRAITGGARCAFRQPDQDAAPAARGTADAPGDSLPLAFDRPGGRRGRRGDTRHTRGTHRPLAFQRCHRHNRRATLRAASLVLPVSYPAPRVPAPPERGNGGCPFGQGPSPGANGRRLTIRADLRDPWRPRLACGGVATGSHHPAGTAARSAPRLPGEHWSSARHCHTHPDAPEDLRPPANVRTLEPGRWRSRVGVPPRVPPHPSRDRGRRVIRGGPRQRTQHRRTGG
jgi:hypothetical protein